MGAQSCVRTGHAVKEVNGEGDSEWPERSIGNVGPVNGGMEHGASWFAQWT